MSHVKEQIARESAKLDAALSAIDTLVGENMARALHAQTDFKQDVRDFLNHHISRAGFIEALKDYLENASEDLAPKEAPPHGDKPYVLIFANTKLFNEFAGTLADAAISATLSQSR